MHNEWIDLPGRAVRLTAKWFFAGSVKVDLSRHSNGTFIFSAKWLFAWPGPFFDTETGTFSRSRSPDIKIGPSPLSLLATWIEDIPRKSCSWIFKAEIVRYLEYWQVIPGFLKAWYQKDYSLITAFAGVAIHIADITILAGQYFDENSPVEAFASRTTCGFSKSTEGVNQFFDRRK